MKGLWRRANKHRISRWSRGYFETVCFFHVWGRVHGILFWSLCQTLQLSRLTFQTLWYFLQVLQLILQWLPLLSEYAQFLQKISILLCCLLDFKVSSLKSDISLDVDISYLWIKVLHVSIHLFQSFEIRVVFLTLRKKISKFLPQFNHLLFILLFIWYFPIYDFTDFITNLFELVFLFFRHRLLLNCQSMQLFFLSFYILL